MTPELRKILVGSCWHTENQVPGTGGRYLGCAHVRVYFYEDHVVKFYYRDETDIGEFSGREQWNELAFRTRFSVHVSDPEEDSDE